MFGIKTVTGRADVPRIQGSWCYWLGRVIADVMRMNWPGQWQDPLPGELVWNLKLELGAVSCQAL